MDSPIIFWSGDWHNEYGENANSDNFIFVCATRIIISDAIGHYLEQYLYDHNRQTKEHMKFICGDTKADF